MANSEVIVEQSQNKEDDSGSSLESENPSDKEDDEEFLQLGDDILRSHMGYGQLGVLPLPIRHDEYEHMMVNFRGENMR